jgi:hypothetical protein
VSSLAEDAGGNKTMTKESGGTAVSAEEIAAAQRAWTTKTPPAAVNNRAAGSPVLPVEGMRNQSTTAASSPADL